MQNNESSVALTLKVLYGVVPIVAGLDKFTNLLVDWSKYLPAWFASALPMSPHAFMMIVGIIEIVAGLIVLSKWTRVGAVIVAAWLVAIALNLIAAGFYDIAVRDLSMAVGAWSLYRLTAPSFEPVRQRAAATA
jgi:uncharacterized membrane protein YphA (DoxX/SURF4 family)